MLINAIIENQDQVKLNLLSALYYIYMSIGFMITSR